MTDEQLELIYKNYLTDKFNRGEISKGKMALFRISEASFEAFKKEYLSEGIFKEKVDRRLSEK